jgi:putative aldouronate transport system permease protein
MNIPTPTRPLDSNGFRSIRRRQTGFAGFFHEIFAKRQLYLLALPGLLVILAFQYIPMTGIVMAFKRYNAVDGIYRSPWVGFRNFVFFFTSGSILRVVANTLILNFFFIITNAVVQMTTAILLNEIRSVRLRKLNQSLMFFPYFLSWVVIGQIVFGFFSSEVGLINSLLIRMGLEPVSWYTDASKWRAILVGVHNWRFIGYGSVIYLAVLTGLDPGLYESATIDGATRVQMIFRITMPLLLPTASILTLLAIGRIFFGDFGMIYAIVRDNGILLQTTEVIDSYVYRSMRQTGEFGMTTAIGLCQSILGLVLVTLSNRAARMLGEGSSLF